MPATTLTRTVRPLPGEVVTVPAGPRAMLRVLTDLADVAAVAPIPAAPDLDPELVVIAAVLQPTRFLAVPLSRRERGRVGGLLEQLGLARVLGRRPHQLTLDDQRRVAVARAVAARAAVIVLDDPAGGLASAAGDALLRDLRAVAVQHDVAVVLLREAATATASALDRAA